MIDLEKDKFFKKLNKMQQLRIVLGYPQNPFSIRDIEDYAKRLIEKETTFISTGCFKFTLAKNGKSIIAEFNTKIKFKLKEELRGEDEKR